MTLRPEDVADPHHFVLTPREMAILCLVATGLTNSEVAGRLHISRHTVAQHLAAMLQRAKAKNRAELVARAYASGTLSAAVWPPSGRRELTGHAATSQLPAAPAA